MQPAILRSSPLKFDSNSSGPNVLWILTTQWRGQALGYAGDPNAATPFLDALAAQSLRFDAAITPHPFGPFARAAILTGIPSPENGVRNYFDPLPSDLPTVADRFRSRGYHTAFIGKWHLAPRDPGAPLVGEAHARTLVPPSARGGFDTWEGFESGFLLNDPWLQSTTDPVPRQFPGYQSDVLVDRLLHHLQSPARPPLPWFAVLSLEPPHPPYDAPAAGVLPPAPETLILPDNVPPEAAARARRELSGYYAHIAATDRALGRLIAALPPDTTIVFTSVHGDMHGSEGLFRKGWPQEESIRVPLLIRARAIAPARIADPVSLLHLESLTLSPTQPPASFGPVECSMPSVVALPDQCDRPWRAIRTASEKTVWDTRMPGTQPWLLYRADAAGNWRRIAAATSVSFTGLAT